MARVSLVVLQRFCQRRYKIWRKYIRLAYVLSDFWTIWCGFNTLKLTEENSFVAFFHSHDSLCGKVFERKPFPKALVRICLTQFSNDFIYFLFILFVFCWGLWRETDSFVGDFGSARKNPLKELTIVSVIPCCQITDLSNLNTVNFYGVTIHTLPNLKCIRWVSVRSSHLPF